MSLFPRPAPQRRATRRPVPPGRAPTRVGRHAFAPDESIPVDPRDPDQRAYCARCGCHGEPGDAKHLGVDEQYPVQDPDVTAAERRRLGEAGDDD